MYEWVEEVDKIVRSLKGKMNNLDTRREVTKNIIDVLNNHEVEARVDCSPRVNTSEVIQHGEFRASVETKHITMMFKYIRVIPPKEKK